MTLDKATKDKMEMEAAMLSSLATSFRMCGSGLPLVTSFNPMDVATLLAKLATEREMAVSEAESEEAPANKNGENAVQ